MAFCYDSSYRKEFRMEIIFQPLPALDLVGRNFTHCQSCGLSNGNTLYVFSDMLFLFVLVHFSILCTRTSQISSGASPSSLLVYTLLVTSETFQVLLKLFLSIHCLQLWLVVEKRIERCCKRFLPLLYLEQGQTKSCAS